MITSIIVWGSLFAAAVFTVAYLLNPRLRAQVEQPKHQFQRQLENFDNSAAQETKRGQQ